MTIAAISPAANAATPSPATGQATKISTDYNTFLRMLTVQMQNQDPLNPIESSDYAVQLATFSGVEQAVRTNELLTEMTSRFQQFGMAEMAGWIGKEARSNAPVHYDGSPVTLSPNPAQGATRAVIAVKDAQGNLVTREEIPVSAAPYRWLGAGADGMPLPPGTYTVSLESMQGENIIDTRPIEHYALVTEARGGVEGTKLVLEGGVEVLATQVTALRSPPT
jgi:flagellar basal-body rod modification protein FlgD